MSPNLHLVLVRSMFANNVGYCCRAAANMGAARVIVIDPRCDLDEFGARQAASGGQKHLDEITTYKSWEDFLTHDGDGLRIAFTRRAGKNRQVPLLPELLEHIQTFPTSSYENIYIILGQEDDGLSAEDLTYANHYAQFPTFGHMGSLNLGHAALMALYITQSCLGAKMTLSTENMRHFQPTASSYDETVIKKWMQLLGNDTSHPTRSIASVISAMVLRSLPSKHELEIWNKVIRSTTRLLGKLKPEDRWQQVSTKESDASRGDRTH